MQIGTAQKVKLLILAKTSVNLGQNILSILACEGRNRMLVNCSSRLEKTNQKDSNSILTHTAAVVKITNNDT